MEIHMFRSTTKAIQNSENGGEIPDAAEIGVILTPKKEEELNALGVVWHTDAGKWAAMLEQMKIYLAENGDCNVPCKYPNNPKLGRWVHTQRNQRKNGELSAERIKILDSISFWDYLPQEALK